MNQSQKVLREISDDPEKSIRIIKNIAMPLAALCCNCPNCWLFGREGAMRRFLADKYHEMRLGRCYTR